MVRPRRIKREKKRMQKAIAAQLINISCKSMLRMMNAGDVA
jgi:ribosomal protein S20